MDTTGKGGRGDKRLLSYSVRLLKTTFRHWLEDKAPQLGAAFAYYTVFFLTPMVLVLLAVFGLIYGNSEVARREILHQLYSFLDRSSAKAVEDIATSAGKPTASALATVVGIAVALLRRQRSIRPVAGGAQHHLGRQTKAREESGQLPAGAVFILRYGSRHVFFASSFADGLGRYHRSRWIPRAPSTWRQRTGVDYPFSVRYQHCYAALRDDLQVSTRREALLARCAL